MLLAMLFSLLLSLPPPEGLGSSRPKVGEE
jgi:hypothetical protein